MRRCVIIGGAPINNYEALKRKFKSDDYFVFCDSGLKHKDKLLINSDFIVGDFDSYKRPEDNKNVLLLPCEKDDTDTFAAVKLMLQNGFREFLIVGVIGKRLDHTLCNVSILLYLKKNGAFGTIIDDYSEMFLCCDRVRIEKDSCRYFSVIALSERLEGVYIKGAKFPLNNAVIENSYQYGVSNEPTDDTEVFVEKGDAMIIKDF